MIALPTAPDELSKAERRMIRRMTKKGGKGFRILRSAEAPIKNYSRGEVGR